MGATYRATLPINQSSGMVRQVVWTSKDFLTLAATIRLSVRTVATHQHPIQAAMLAVIVIESGLMH